MNDKIPAKEKGGLLEDMVADVFRGWGFDVETRLKMKDRSDVIHEIDVLASKKEAFGVINIAIECKYVKEPIDIKEIRNFHDKLDNLGFTKGIFVSTAGFTSEATAHAKSLGIETWDLATLQEKTREISAPKAMVIHDAIPLNSSMDAFMISNQLPNGNLLQLADSATVRYVPFYFVDYHCFSQSKVGGTVVTLESKGRVAINASDEQIWDSATYAGVTPFLARGGQIIDCSCLKSQTLTEKDFHIDPKLINPTLQVVQFKMTPTQAKALAQREISKHLALKYEYYVYKHRKTWKIIKPVKKDVEITNCQFCYIPITDLNLKVKDKQYYRSIQAATLKFLKDETGVCKICQKPSVVICENCGTIVCKEHWKQCEVCKKNLCDNCKISIGFILKKYYCPEHRPK